MAVHRARTVEAGSLPRASLYHQCAITRRHRFFFYFFSNLVTCFVFEITLGSGNVEVYFVQFSMVGWFHTLPRDRPPASTPTINLTTLSTHLLQSDLIDLYLSKLHMKSLACLNLDLRTRKRHAKHILITMEHNKDARRRHIMEFS